MGPTLKVSGVWGAGVGKGSTVVTSRESNSSGSSRQHLILEGPDRVGEEEMEGKMAVELVKLAVEVSILRRDGLT